jgi:3-hydroxybutyryl-CoA dehydrogenase
VCLKWSTLSALAVAARCIGPDIVIASQRARRPRTGAGFLDYSGLVDAYREQRLAATFELLRHFGLARPPVLRED